ADPFIGWFGLVELWGDVLGASRVLRDRGERSDVLYVLSAGEDAAATLACPADSRTRSHSAQMPRKVIEASSSRMPCEWLGERQGAPPTTQSTSSMRW